MSSTNRFCYLDVHVMYAILVTITANDVHEHALTETLFNNIISKICV